MTVTLLIGGARAGKSGLAVRIASGWTESPVFVATARAGDEEMADRIARHRAERPGDWTTVEEPLDLEAAVAGLPPASPLILDCLTLWVANAMESGLGDDEIEARAARAADAVAGRGPDAVVVTNEVGSGIVPANDLARRFRDVLGRVNIAWADRADRVLLVVAGRALPLTDTVVG